MSLPSAKFKMLKQNCDISTIVTRPAGFQMKTRAVYTSNKHRSLVSYHTTISGHGFSVNY